MAAGTGARSHPLDFPGKGAHQLGIGTTGVVNPVASTTVGKVFTTAAGSSPTTWTERLVVVGTSTTDYEGKVELQFSSAWNTPPPSAASQADTARTNYINALASGPGSLSATYSYTYDAVPTSASTTPTGWSTKMYRVQTLETSGWVDQGLMFREINGQSYRDLYLLEAGYNAATKEEDVKLVPITSGSQYYADRKDFVAGEHAAHSGGYFIDADYTLKVD